MTVRSDVPPLSQLLLRADAIADGAPATESIASGFPSLDRLLGGGFRRGDLIVLGGDVGVGKSALALAMALRATRRGRTVALLTGEMEPERVLERALAIEGRASLDVIRRGSLDDATRASIGAAALKMRDALPEIVRIPAGGPAATADAARALLDAELVIVDGLQSLPHGVLPQDEELAQGVRALKRVAMDANIAVLVTAHVPELSRDRADPRPTLDDFGALGAVKQHADLVLALYREELYREMPGQEGATELAILKNRGGATSYIDLYFYAQWLRFEDMVEPDR